MALVGRAGLVLILRFGGVRLGPPGWSGAWDGLIPGKGFHEAFSPASP